jgi:hypothetical protein
MEKSIETNLNHYLLFSNSYLEKHSKDKDKKVSFKVIEENNKEGTVTKKTSNY